MSLCVRSKEMKKTIVSLLALLLCAGCSEKLSPEEQAMNAAKEAAQACYADLLAGRYEQFLQGRAGMDSIPEGYREQLVASYKQFLSQQRDAHGGITSFQVNNARIDSTQQLIQVFLILHFADSTQEEIVVPMVEQNGQWKIK